MIGNGGSRCPSRAQVELAGAMIIRIFASLKLEQQGATRPARRPPTPSPIAGSRPEAQALMPWIGQGQDFGQTIVERIATMNTTRRDRSPRRAAG